MINGDFPRPLAWAKDFCAYGAESRVTKMSKLLDSYGLTPSLEPTLWPARHGINLRGVMKSSRYAGRCFRGRWGAQRVRGRLRAYRGSCWRQHTEKSGSTRTGQFSSRPIPWPLTGQKASEPQSGSCSTRHNDRQAQQTGFSGRALGGHGCAQPMSLVKGQSDINTKRHSLARLCPLALIVGKPD